MTAMSSSAVGVLCTSFQIPADLTFLLPLLPQCPYMFFWGGVTAKYSLWLSIPLSFISSNWQVCELPQLPVPKGDKNLLWPKMAASLICSPKSKYVEDNLRSTQCVKWKVSLVPMASSTWLGFKKTYKFLLVNECQIQSENSRLP